MTFLFKTFFIALMGAMVLFLFLAALNLSWAYLVGGAGLLIAVFFITTYRIKQQIAQAAEQARRAEEEKRKVRYVIIK